MNNFEVGVYTPWGVLISCFISPSRRDWTTYPTGGYWTKWQEIKKVDSFKGVASTVKVLIPVKRGLKWISGLSGLGKTQIAFLPAIFYSHNTYWKKCLGGGTGRRKGLKIPRALCLYEFDSRPGHQVIVRGSAFLAGSLFSIKSYPSARRLYFLGLF